MAELNSQAEEHTRHFQERKGILKSIEKARSSSAILYVTGDRPGMITNVAADVVELFVDHLDEMWPIERLSLILYTSGGDAAASWRIINLLRIFCEDLEIIVPLKAHSAGTLMCLGANKIVMTKQATLGPIDPSLNGPLNPQVPGGNPQQKVPVSVEAVQGYIDVVRNNLRIEDPASLTSIWNHLSDKIHPLVLGQIFRTRSQIRDIASRLLKYQQIDEGKKEALISFLCSESGSHDHTINRREASHLGLVVEKPTEQLYQLVKALHTNLVKDLELRIAFNPDTVLGGAMSTRYRTRRALIESRAYGSHQFISEGQLNRVQITVNGMPSTTVKDTRTFDGWRKEE